MANKPKPDWFPENPYPIEVFPMSVDRYIEIVPDPDIRTALSGCLGRLFWEIASDMIWREWQRHMEDEDDGE